MSSLIRLVLFRQHLRGHNKIPQMYSVKDIQEILQPSIQLCPNIPSMSIHLQPPPTNLQSLDRNPCILEFKSQGSNILKILEVFKISFKAQRTETDGCIAIRIPEEILRVHPIIIMGIPAIDRLLDMTKFLPTLQLLPQIYTSLQKATFTIHRKTIFTILLRLKLRNLSPTGTTLKYI